MKRLTVFILLIFIGFTFIYAGPFGLSNGMSLDEVTKACGGIEPRNIGDDDRYVICPKKSHPKFKTYIAWINEEYGLYYVRGISDPINTNDYGEEIKDEFYAFKDRLEAIYGKPLLVDKLTDSKTIFKEEQYWLNTLERGARQLYAEWDITNEQVNMKDELIYIRLWGAYSSYKKTELIIDYGFMNTIMAEIQEDEVL